MDEINSGENLFHFYLDPDQVYREYPELLDPDVTTPVEVVFYSNVHRYALDHSSFDNRKSRVRVDMTITRCRCDDFRKLSSSIEILSKRLCEANPNITPGTDLHDKIVNEIVTEVNRSIPELHKLLTVGVNMTGHVFDRCECGECRAIRESELMAEKLIVPASESPIKKRVRVPAASALEEEHEDRQRKRRRTRSHYCPKCQYEMPVADDQEDE